MSKFPSSIPGRFPLGKMPTCPQIFDLLRREQAVFPFSERFVQHKCAHGKALEIDDRFSP